MAFYSRGWGLFQIGQVEEGLDGMRQGGAKWLATGARLAMTHYDQQLAQAYLSAGDDQNAWDRLEKGFSLVETGPFWEAELHRLRGELLIRRAALAGARPRRHAVALSKPHAHDTFPARSR